MASILDTLEPQQARNILSGLIKNLTPQPDDPVPPDETSSALLGEFQLRAKVKPEDNSEQAVGKLLTLLTQEFTARLLDKDSEVETRKRLGMRGLLPLNDYEIVFEDLFQEAERLGIVRAQAAAAIHHPDKVQHLLPDRATNAPAVSIFVKREEPRKNPSVLLVECRRDGPKLMIGSVWRIFLSDFPDLVEASAPIDWLRAFAYKYGLPFFVGDQGPFQFLAYEVIAHSHEKLDTLFRFNNPHNDSFHTSFFLKFSPLSVVEIAIAYAINITAYVRDLRRHGLPILFPTK